MKKLQIISEKIENKNSNYFGRGSFETVIKENKEEVLSWFEELVPVQEQIRLLQSKFGCENLQKRNYVRIITKLFPEEYNQFVCLNILLRDIDSITLAFIQTSNTKEQYELLLFNKKLKFPGKHEKCVDFDTYQKFITLYKNDLITKSHDFETEEILVRKTDESELEKYIIKEIKEDIQLENEIDKKEKTSTDENISSISTRKDKQDKTNWMNVLLKGI